MLSCHVRPRSIFDIIIDVIRMFDRGRYKNVHYLKMQPWMKFVV